MMFRIQLIVLTAAILLSSTCAVAQQPLPATGSEAQLLEVLQSDAELFEKAKACQRLAVIGTSKSVPVLAGLLGDENLSHYARFGLESNPSPEVDQALRKALGELEGQPLVGVINSIGVRRDEKAVDALIAALGDAIENDDQSGAAAVMGALGRIASPESVAAIEKLLRGDPGLRVAAADACLTAADALLGEKRNAEAAKLFAAVRAAELPKHIDVASRLGEIRVGAQSPVDLMVQYLSASDNDLFRIGLELAHGLKGEKATRELLKQLETQPVQRRTLLIGVLGSRGDRAALPAVVERSRSDIRDVRLASIKALGVLGDVSVVPVLIDAAVSGDEELAGAASESLAQLGGKEVDSAIVDALAGSSGPARVALVEAIGRRGISDAIPTLLNDMSADDPQLAAAAINALGMTVGVKDLPQMVDRLIEGDSADRSASSKQDPIKEALRKACQRMPDRDAAATLLLDRMDGASPSAKAELLDLLIYVGGAKALEGIGNAAKSSDDAIADSATQALGKWLTPDVAPVLLDLAQNGNPKYRIRCLRGFIRVIRQFGLRQGQRLQMSRAAFNAATRDEERKLVLDTLTRFPSAAALKVAMPHLSNPALRDEAAKSAVTICEKIVAVDRATVASAMPKVLAVIDDPDLVDRAKVVLARAQ